MKKEDIKEFVEKNFKIHSDWTGNYVEASPDTIGRTLENLVDKLDKFINKENL